MLKVIKSHIQQIIVKDCNKDSCLKASQLTTDHPQFQCKIRRKWGIIMRVLERVKYSITEALV